MMGFGAYVELAFKPAVVFGAGGMLCGSPVANPFEHYACACDRAAGRRGRRQPALCA